MGLLNNLIDWIVAFATGFFGNVLAHDFCEVTPMISKKLIKMAESRLPKSMRQRYSEEWSADLQDQVGALAKLFWAFGCLISVCRLRQQSKLDLIQRTSHEFVLTTGEIVAMNTATLVFFRNVGNLLFSGQRRRLPSRLTAGIAALYITFVLRPYTEWRWRQRADADAAFQVLDNLGVIELIRRRVDGKEVDAQVIEFKRSEMR